MSEAQTRAARYTAVAIVLHWAIAAAIAFNIFLGWWMHEAIETPASAARAFIGYQTHKSVGLTVLLLSLIRLGWRIANPPPPLPARMPGWEKRAAKATHWAFYALMIALPLTGWLYVSAGWSHEGNRPFDVPTVWFGVLPIPHLFGLEHAANATRASVADTAMEAHELLVWIAIALFFLHVGAALKHWLIDRDDVLPQMAPGVPVLGAAAQAPADPQRRNALLIGFAVLALAAFGTGAFFLRPLETAPALAETTVEDSAPATEAAAPTREAAPATTAPASAAAPSSGPPPVWRVNAARSSIRFSGEQGGARFNGAFSRWHGDIRFDPANLAASTANVTIETASAADGNPLHDPQFATADWFDSANHPNATFRATRFTARGGDRYEARGDLTIKGHTVHVALPFTLAITGDQAVMSGHVSVDRRAVGLGVGSEADEYVSQMIDVTVRVEAQRAP